MLSYFYTAKQDISHIYFYSFNLNFQNIVPLSVP